jgi:hypothetical protein
MERLPPSFGNLLQQLEETEKGRDHDAGAE